ncbi:Penicillinase repressor [Anaerolineae bacterium]|nr:Penicillinase repressor [Anaerolineae bacterium]
MRPPPLHRLGDLQLQIMKVLWTRGEASVAEVHNTLGREPRFAYTTIATMLRKMEARGLVGHRTDGRTFIYAAAVDEAKVSRGRAEHVLDRLFAGSVADLVSHLLSAREVSREELARIERFVAERRRAS